MAEYSEWSLQVSEIKGKMERGELIVDPDWQRGYIWKKKDEKLLIDSIIQGVPIPKFYLTQEYDVEKSANIHYVVDGQQRLTALYLFLSNKFAITRDNREKYFRDLDNPLQRRICSYNLNGHFLQNFTQQDINFLFQRLNSTGFKLTNMENWNNEFTDTNILKTIKAISDEHRSYYVEIVYTNENIHRMLQWDDVIDLCNCLLKQAVQGAGKKDLEGFLSTKKNITDKKSAYLQAMFRKVMYNLKKIFNRQDLSDSLYSKRTHFISLFLAIGDVVSTHYLLQNPPTIKQKLLDFIVNQPTVYKESVMGAIRQKTKRQTRVNLLKDVLLPQAIRLDTKRLFPGELKHRLWNEKPHKCALCGKPIRQFSKAVLDHITPWAKGGKTKESNAQLTHKTCNQRKKDREEKSVIW